MSALALLAAVVALGFGALSVHFARRAARATARLRALQEAGPSSHAVLHPTFVPR